MSRFLRKDPMLEPGEEALLDAYLGQGPSSETDSPWEDWIPVVITGKLADGSYMCRNLKHNAAFVNYRHFFFIRPRTPEHFALIGRAKVAAVKTLLKGG